ncbi:MAG: glycosyltransferase [Clostridiales bacterium]|nr:glycosyltransferase [Clostridiales bacterium]
MYKNTAIICFVSNFFQISVFFISTYYFIISFFSFARRKNIKIIEKLNSYAIVIAAHNEQNVICDILRSLRKLDYSRKKYDIFVVADNCTDSTALNAKKCGAKVFERFDTVNCGKGFALDFAFKKILDLPVKYDFFAVFDCDNIIRKDFFDHINKQVNAGYKAVQGRIESKNPFDSLISLSIATWYWINNRTFQLSRHNLGISCQIGGTGFVVETSLIDKIGWSSYCIAEDAEFTLKLAIKDIKVGYSYDAQVFDEKPIKLKTSIMQRIRWAKGIAKSGFNFIIPLFKKGIKEKKLQPFNDLLTFFSSSLFPILYVLLLLFDIKAIKIILNSKGYFIFNNIWTIPTNFILLNTILIGELFVIFYGLYKDKKIGKYILSGIFGYIFYIISWVPIVFIGIFKKRENDWFHTPHKTNQKPDDLG